MMQRLTRTCVFVCLVFLIGTGCNLMGSNGDGDPPPEDDKTVAVVEGPSHAYA